MDATAARDEIESAETTMLARDEVDESELEVLRQAIGRLGEASPLARALEGLARTLDSGAEVLVSASHEEVSPQQAARVLKISRPTVYKLIDSGDLPAHKVGSHHRIPVPELLAYKARKQAAQSELAEMFAHASANEAKLVRELAGLDEETATRLGGR